MASLEINRSGPPTGPARGAGPVPAILLLLLLFSAAPAPAGPPTGESSQRSDMAGEIISLIRADLRDEALPLCRSFNERFPGDPVMLYNQACLENTAGLADEAAATFGKAVAAGFDDFARALEDPELAGLERHPAVAGLIREFRITQSRLAAERAVSLSWKEPSAPITLADDHGGPDSVGPEIYLTWQPAGLVLELKAAAPWSALLGPGNLAPWNGGSGLVVTLGVPDGDDPGTFQTANHFVFAFGMEKDLPVGAAYLPAQKRWQPVSELQPKIRLDENEHLELRTLIPWAGILPYDPLVDDRLGFNAAVRLAGTAGGKSASVLADPASFRPSAEFRRIVPLSFLGDTITEEMFVGKASHTISETEPVTIDLVAVSGEEGSGILTIDFLGGPEQSLLPEGQSSQPVELSRGLNKLTRQADFSALKTGTYVIKAGLTLPSGRSFTWGSTILQTAPGWREDFLTRIEKLSPQERRTARFHLETITAAVDNHPARRSPGAIVTAINELGGLLDNAETGGTILPDKGSFLAVYPGPDGDSRLCHMYFPAKWKVAARLNPVLVITGAPGQAAALADRMGQNYEQGRRKPTLKGGPDEGFPIYLAPRLGPLENRIPGDLTAEAEAALSWILESFEATTVSVAATDSGAGAALQLAPRRAGALKALIIFAGRSLEPWPQADASFVEAQLAGFPRDLPVTWADFRTETRLGGQGPLILETLKNSGAEIVDVVEVRGGLNFTQVADRTVLWAEGLR